MKYERITERREIPLVMSQWSGTSKELRIYNRLAELEDKIEQGMLVSIPFIRKHPKIDNAYMVVYENEHGDLLGKMYCGENAQVEAEAKLKEIQNERISQDRNSL